MLFAAARKLPGNGIMPDGKPWRDNWRPMMPVYRYFEAEVQVGFLFLNNTTHR